MSPVNRRAAGVARVLNRAVVTPIGMSGRYRKIVGGEDKALSEVARGKVVLISGASSGIGEAAARLLARHGAVVLLVARGVEALEHVRRLIEDDGGVAHAYPCDLTDYDALDAMVAKVLADHGHVDVLVNNAGHSIRRKVERSEGRFHDFERLIQLNYLSAIRLVLALLPTMRERHSGQVINISSWAVQVRPARFAGYTASKAALEAWSDSVQGEVSADGVLFTTIRMPLVRTPMIAPTKLYRRVPALTPDEAAATIGDAMVSHPRRLRPGFSPLMDVADAFSARSLDRIRNRVL